VNITYVTNRSWPALGGVETYLRHLSRAVAAEHDVTVLAQGIDSKPWSQLADSVQPPSTFAPFDDDGVAVLPIRLPAGRRALLAPLAAQVVPVLRRYAWGRSRVVAARYYASVAGHSLAAQARGADLIHVFGTDLLAAAALRAGRILGIPVVATPFAHRGHWGDTEACAVTYRELDRVIALLESDALLYEELGVPRERIVVGGVCTPDVMASDGAGLRGRLGIDGPLVVFLGVRRAYKGAHLLLEAAPAVSRNVPGTTFAFVGPGPALPQVTGARVLDVGAVDDDQRAAWLAASDVLCLPSEAEIFPSSFLEAWTASTPVVAADIPPLRELVTRSGGGVVAERSAEPLAAALTSLLLDPARARALGAAGHAFWKSSFTVEAVARLHDELYRACCLPAATVQKAA
jgi:glycosyltransferase involved in cell wall biosynthesis